MTPAAVQRSVENHIGFETRLPAFRDILAFVLQKIRAYGDARDGWSFDFTKAALNTEAPYETGTVEVAQSSAAVVGTGTTWTGITNNRHKLRVGGIAYPITTITDDTNIVLTENYAGTSGSGNAYSIVRDEYVLPALRSVRWVWDTTRQRRLECVPVGKLGDMLARGNVTSGDPLAYSIVGRTATTNFPILQLFPYPTDIRRLEYWYQSDYDRVADFGTEIDLPNIFDDLLRVGALARALQVLRQDGWRDEWQMFQIGLRDAWFQDNPARDVRIRLMRQDGVEFRQFADYPGWSEVTV